MPTRVPIGFRELLYEIHLETPISDLLSSKDEAHGLMRSYLDDEDDVFSDLAKSQFIFQEFPVLALCIEKIRRFLNSKYLPKEVSNVVSSLLDFNDEFLRLLYNIDGYDIGPHVQGGAMKYGESPALFAKTVFKRLPNKVKADKRVFVYDNCCHFHKHVLRRYPWQSRKWHFVVDRHH